MIKDEFRTRILFVLGNALPSGSEEAKFHSSSPAAGSEDGPPPLRSTREEDVGVDRGRVDAGAT
jgi:hypothetical protein